MEILSLLINIIIYILCIAACINVGIQKGRNGFLYGILLGPLGLIILTYLASKLDPLQDEQHNINPKQFKDYRHCPFCDEKINANSKFCQHCGKNILEYDATQSSKDENDKSNSSKYKSVEDFFNDEDIIKEANVIRRIYGKSLYIRHLNEKAKEFGLGDINLTEDDVE